MVDKPMSLAKLLNAIGGYDIVIISSISKTIERGKTAEWSAIADVSQCRNFKQINGKLLAMEDIVKSVDVAME